MSALVCLLAAGMGRDAPPRASARSRGRRIPLPALRPTLSPRPAARHGLPCLHCRVSADNQLPAAGALAALAQPAAAGRVWSGDPDQTAPVRGRASRGRPCRCQRGPEPCPHWPCSPPAYPPYGWLSRRPPRSRGAAPRRHPRAAARSGGGRASCESAQRAAAQAAVRERKSGSRRSESAQRHAIRAPGRERREARAAAASAASAAKRFGVGSATGASTEYAEQVLNCGRKKR